MLRALIGDDGASSSGSSVSMIESESQTSSYQLPDPTQTKEKYKSFKSWKFLDTIQADVLVDEFEERMPKLIEHFRTRTTPNRPIGVRSITIFADLKPFVLAPPSENPTVSIAIIGYVETIPSTQYTMTKWIPSITWDTSSNLSQGY